MASIQEVVKQMHASGESDARIQQVIDAYKQSKAQQAKDIADAKRIASYINIPQPIPSPRSDEEKEVKEPEQTIPEFDYSQIEGKNPAHTKKLREYHKKMQENPNFTYNPNTGGYDKNKVLSRKEQNDLNISKGLKTIEEQEQDIALAKQKEQDAADKAYLESPHMTYDQMNDINSWKKFGLGDKEGGWVENLSKHYDGQNLTFTRVDEFLSGVDDEIEVKDSFGRKFRFRPGRRASKSMKRLHDWINKGREMEMELRKKKRDPNYKEIDPKEVVLPTDKVNVRKKELENVIEEQPIMSNERIEAEKEVKEIQEEEDKLEFDSDVHKKEKLAKKYNDGISSLISNHHNYLVNEKGLDPNSDEYKLDMERVLRQYDSTFPQLGDVERYQGVRQAYAEDQDFSVITATPEEYEEYQKNQAGDPSPSGRPTITRTIPLEEKKKKQTEIELSEKEINQLAIEELKRDIQRGYKGDIGKDYKDIDWSDWLSEEEEWKLLDGLSRQEIMQLAGVRQNKQKKSLFDYIPIGRGYDVTVADVIDWNQLENSKWSSDMKQDQINKVKDKVLKHKSREINKDFDKKEEQYNAVIKTSDALQAEKTHLTNRTQVLNAQLNPLVKEMEKIQTEKTTKEAEIKKLHDKIESQNPQTQEEIDSYNNDISNYQSMINSYNNLITGAKPLFDRYDVLSQQAEGLQSEQNDFNERANLHVERAKIVDGEMRALRDSKIEIMEDFGNHLVDNMFVRTNDYVSLDDYEKWRKENKITRGFMDPDSWGLLLSGGLNTVAKYYTGTPLLAVNMINEALGKPAGGNDHEYTRLDAMNAMYERYSNYDYFNSAKEHDYETGEMSWSDKGAKAVAEGLPFMLAIMASSGKEALNPATWGKFIGKKALDVDFANKIRMGVTAFNITAMDNKLEGKKMGLTDGQASIYGSLIGTATAVVQGIMPDINLIRGGGEGVLSQISKEGLVGTLKSIATKEGARIAGGQYLNRIGLEIAEEEVEMFLQDGVKHAFGLHHTAEFGEIDNHLKLIHDTAWLTGTTGSIGSKKDFNRVRQRIYNDLKGNTTEMMKTIDYMSVEVNKKLQEAKRTGDVDAIKDYEFELEKLKKSKEYVQNFKNAVNVAPENVTDAELQLLTEKQRLLELKKNQDPVYHAAIDKQLENLNKKIEESIVTKNAKENNKKALDRSLKAVKSLQGTEGGNMKTFEEKDGVSAQEQINEWLAENGYTEEDIKNAQGMFGTNLKNKDGETFLIVNKDVALDGSVEGGNVAAHEFLHQMLETTFAQTDANGDIIRDQDGNIKVDKKKALAIGTSLGMWISEMQGTDFENSEMARRLNTAYASADANIQAQEVLTTLSDALVSGDMVFENGPMVRLGDFLRRIFQEKLGVDVKFNTGKDVFNFIKDYNRTIAKGKQLSRAQRKAMTEGIQIGGDIQALMESDLIHNVQQEEDQRKREKMLKDNNIPTDSDLGKALMQSKPSDLAGLLDKYDGNKRRMISETLSKTKDGRDIYSLKRGGDYVDNPFVMSEFGQEIAPIVETITKRLFDPIPQNLRNGITRGQFMNDLTAIAAGLVENEFDASKQNLDKFISNRLNLRANRLASDLGIESTVEEGGLGAAVGLDQAAELTTEDTGPVTEKTTGIKLLDRIASPETKAKIEKKINSKIKGDKIEIDGELISIDKLNYKNLKSLIANEIAEMFGVKSVKNYTEKTKTLKNDDVIRARMFIGKNADVLYQILPLGVTASGTATGIKQVIVKNFYTKSDKRVKFDKKEGGAGLFPQVKNQMTGEQFAAVFGYEKGMLTQVKGQNPATLISGLMDEVGKAITNQVVRQTLDKRNVNGDVTMTGRIGLLGDGKSDMLFSQASIAKTGKENSVLFYEKIGLMGPKNLLIADGNMTNALKTHFHKEIKEGTFDVKGQTTEQLIEKVGKQLQTIYNRMTSGQSIPPTQVFNGQFISDIVMDQFIQDNLNDTPRYKTIAGKDIKSINDPEVGKSARRALQELSKAFSPEFNEKWLVPSIAHASKYANGKYQFKPGTLEYEVSKSKRGETNRFGLANNAEDARSLFGLPEPTRKKPQEGIPAHKPPKTGQGLPSEANMTRIVQEQQEANQAMREVVKELKRLYNNGDISKNDVVAILQSMNANPRALTRMSAILDYIPTDNSYKGVYVLEHMTPALQINLSALNSILSPEGSQADIDFKNDMDGYKVAYLPKKYDNLVNTIYKSTKPIYGQESVFRYYNTELPGFDLEMKQLSTGNIINQGFVFDPKQQKLFKDNNAKAVNYKGSLYFSKASDSNAETNRKNTIISNAIKQARLISDPRGITVLDFDDTLATTKSRIKFTRPDGTKGSLNAEEYARDYQDLTDKGYTWDFSEFNDVVGGELAPLFNKAIKLSKKFGTENMFILTARPQAAAGPIQAFLKAHGLDIPLKNITGLGNSTSEAKALWVAEKVGEGYNDFYFADDALQNVQAVKNMLDQFDVKSKIQQAKLNLFSKSSEMFNEIIEDSAGVNKFATFSDAKAKKRGASRGKYGIFIPPSADDFKGLMYKFIGKGKKGEMQLEWFDKMLMTPFARATQEMDRLKSRLSNDYRALNNRFKNVKKKLNKTVPTGDFTYDTAIRVYNWTKQGLEIDGLSKQDQKNLVAAVESDVEMVAYAKGLESITNGYPAPGDYWMTETITSDLNGLTENDNRKEMLAEFIQNRKEIFGEWKNGKLIGPNMNKIEAIYGTKFRNALEDMLWRMENGTNRNFGTNGLTNRFANWVNNSVGAIMFFNARSAVLQTLSTVNFINWSFNNPLKAAAAFANQPQFWKDFSMIFNSDMLKQRRSGLRTSVSHAELAEAASGSKNPAKAVFQKLLKMGFLPTQIADSFAIAAGGATFYRNRVSDLVNKGMSQAEAEAQAFTEFQQKAEETQQSSRPDMISQQQASPLGRLILAFQNTPMQYTRLMKKAMLDIINGRGDFKHNVSKILYYGAVQNFIFSALQKAMFAFAFDDDDDEDKKKQKKKELQLANGMLDSLLRGMGVGGAVVSTLKNMILKFAEENKKGWNADYDKVIIEFLNMSPPVGSKARKLKSAFSTYQFNREVIEYMPKNTLDNPMWEAVGNVVSSLTNVPLDRVINKANNIKEAMNSDNEAWQRIALSLGWNRWDIDVQNEAREQAKKEVKEIKEQKQKEKEAAKKEAKRLKEEKERKEKEAREVRCSAKTRKGKGPRCKNMTENKNGKCYAHQ